MKRFILFSVIALFLFSCCTSIAETFNLDSLTEEELLDLRTRIDGKIVARNKGDLIYDKDGVQIKWMGLDTQAESFFKLIMMVTNPFDHSVFFEIEEGAFNGIQITCANGFGYEISSGMTFITSSCNLWLFNNDDLAIVDMTTDDISDVYIKFAINTESFGGDTLLSDEIKFAIK